MDARGWFSIAAFAILITPGKIDAADASRAANATNEMGVDFYRKLASGNDNLCLSPYAIENALAMTLAGAEGQTREEMARVLHRQRMDKTVHASFDALRRALADLVEQSIKRAGEIKKHGSSEEPIMLAIAGRLFAQRGYDFHDAFVAIANENYGAPIEPVDYVNAAERVPDDINSWVAEQTHGRIRDLVSAGAFDAKTRLVLVNAIYLKAPWATPFSADRTQPRPFRVRGEAAVNVSTMFAPKQYFGYAKRGGYTAVSVAYAGSDLQFLIFLPDDAKDIHTLERNISAGALASAARLEARELDLYLPKFKLDLPALDLGATLQTLGMQTAFDHPAGSANFEGIAPRRPNDYLFLSAVFHKTFIAIDEVGTEAMAADALPVTVYSAEVLRKKPKPLVVKVDRPFLYAIQHVPSGVCLFVGRVTDPR